MNTKPSLRFLQVDVFTARAGGGNPLGVVIGAHDWSSARMQAFAAWTQLVETTFLLPPPSATTDYQLRIFTPFREIAFAGHPSIGSAHAALEAGIASACAGQLQQACLAGEIALRVEGDGPQRRIFVQTPAADTVTAAPVDWAALATLMRGLDLGQLPPALVAGGRRWWLAELADETSLRAWQPDHAAIARLANASDSLGLCVFARSTSADFELVVRAFPCGVGINEDPASGAANGLIAAFLRMREPDGALAQGYRVSQGRELGRDAMIEVRYDASGRSWIGGQTQTVIDGRLNFPLPPDPAAF
ncbi:MAG: PhzF family phenazine biosynthesis protein [Pseudomarimonas sp.]